MFGFGSFHNFIESHFFEKMFVHAAFMVLCHEQHSTKKNSHTRQTTPKKKHRQKEKKKKKRGK
jgi:hypothetical protein